MSVTFLQMCREIYLFTQMFAREESSGVGRAWEMFVDAYLARRGLPVEAASGGYRVFGYVPASGLAHQIDSGVLCGDALVVSEWKAHRKFPKNELLRFKAATDDFFMALHPDPPGRPVFRVFGGPGSASESLRSYAAMHGICVIERGRWPAPVVASSIWEALGAEGPSVEDRNRLSWLVRPVQAVLIPYTNGYLTPRSPGHEAVRSLIDMHEYWSARLWEAVDTSEGILDRAIADVTPYPRSA
jgi:hypothetical protein